MGYVSPRRAEQYRAVFQEMNLWEALEEGARRRWAGKRSEESIRPQARVAIRTLAPMLRPELEGADVKTMAERVMVKEITQPLVLKAIEVWQRTVVAGTVNARLSALAAMGVDVSGLRLHRPARLKWWLTPENQEKACKALRGSACPVDRIVGDYVDWACHTGMRVEESLRLTRSHFAVVEVRGLTRVTVTVPGLKTAAAQATLPLSEPAAAIVMRRFSPDALPGDPLFPITYRGLSRCWNSVRLLIGARESTATLKALRRSAARNLTVNGMPMDLLRSYLRHENLKTTAGYLQLTGGYRTEEFARWL